MKTILFLLLMFVTSNVFSQVAEIDLDNKLQEAPQLYLGLNQEKKSKKFINKQLIIGTLLCGTSGVSAGVRETVLNHYGSFEKRFPNVNDQWANPALSWKNKYKNFDEGDTRPKFVGSKTIFVWTTDLYHLSNSVSKSTLLAGGLVMTLGEKKPFWQHATNFIIGSAAYSVGFHLSYSLIFK